MRLRFRGVDEPVIRSGTALLVVGLILGPGCAAGPGKAGAESGDAGWETVFVLARAPEARGPIWVQESDGSSQPGWISVSGPAPTRERVHLLERCELPECGVQEGVCGMAIPVVRRLEPGDSIRFVWNGRTSRLSTDGRCERREPALDGTYAVRFCWTDQEPLEPPSPGEGTPLPGVTCQTLDAALPGATRVAWRVE